ncbi:MAG TPA: hypothetical protein VGE27_15420 [Gemmatimonas sp.]|uniref:hypothetical protein n=1 Tax=Gemmatimonas sp. TaxID=1962908 RepID=UPI002EDB0F9E
MTTPDETVGELATLYLGNVLYAIERCALSLEAEGKPVDASFYRGIGRKLAEAHGRTRNASAGSPPSGDTP